MAGHTVVLNWTASVDTNVSTYNVYRGIASGKESTLLNATPVSGTTYTDAAPVEGEDFYVVRSVLNGIESVNSNEATAVILPTAPTGLTATSE
jgi:hypothetical protein